MNKKDYSRICRSIGNICIALAVDFSEKKKEKVAKKFDKQAIIFFNLAKIK